MLSFFQKQEKTNEEKLLEIYKTKIYEEGFFKIKAFESNSFNGDKFDLIFSIGDYEGKAIVNLSFIENKNNETNFNYGLLLREKTITEKIIESVFEEKIKLEEFIKTNFEFPNTIFVTNKGTEISFHQGLLHDFANRREKTFLISQFSSLEITDFNCKISCLKVFVEENLLNFIEFERNRQLKLLTLEMKVKIQEEEIRQSKLIDKELKKLLNVKELDEDMKKKFEILKEIEGIYKSIGESHDKILELRDKFYSI